MPIGIITNISVVFLGALIGTALKKHFPEYIKQSLTTLFGFCSILIAVVLIININALTPVILSLTFGMLIGELFKLEDKLMRYVQKIQSLLNKAHPFDAYHADAFITIFVLFCFSGTGIFGSLNEGLTADPSILLAKSVLDFFTAIIFATTLGSMVAMIAIPQAVVFFALYFSASFILPLITPAMLGDFKAVGGAIALVAGFRILQIKQMKVVNLLPSLMLIFPISYLWSLLF